MSAASVTPGVTSAFDAMWGELADLGRDTRTNGYRRFAWTAVDHDLREWFTAQAHVRGLDVMVDRVGNQWAWWGDPDQAVAAGRPGLVMGSHLDSVPDGGAFDGPLGVVSALAAIDQLRAWGTEPRRPVGVVNFVDEEGARFGVACAGSRVLTGALDPQRAVALTDQDGTTLGEALQRAGRRPEELGRDDEVLRRVGAFVELHVEQGRGLADLDRSVAVGHSIVPHGRWRLELTGEANHAGTTRLLDRRDPMLSLAAAIMTARATASQLGCVATIGKVRVDPNGVNAIPSRVEAWLDARGPREPDVRAVAAEVARHADGVLYEESFTAATDLTPSLRDRLARVLDDAPVLATGAGHDAGVLAQAGIPSAMLFVRNPTGVSHSPREFATINDCHEGVEALARVARNLITDPPPAGSGENETTPYRDASHLLDCP